MTTLLGWKMTPGHIEIEVETEVRSIAKFKRYKGVNYRWKGLDNNTQVNREVNDLLDRLVVSDDSIDDMSINYYGIKDPSNGE